MRKKNKQNSCSTKISVSPSPFIALSNCMSRPDVIQLFKSPTTIECYHLFQSIGLPTSIPQYPFLHLTLMKSFWGFQGVKKNDDLLNLELAIRNAIFSQRHPFFHLLLKKPAQSIVSNKELRMLVHRLINQRIERGIMQPTSEAIFNPIDGNVRNSETKTEETRIYFQNLSKLAHQDTSGCVEHKLRISTEKSFPTCSPNKKINLKKYEARLALSVQKTSKQEKGIRIDTILEEDEEKQEKMTCSNETQNLFTMNENLRLLSNADLNVVNHARKSDSSATAGKNNQTFKLFENGKAKLENGAGRNRRSKIPKHQTSIEDINKMNIKVFDFSKISFRDWIESELKSIEESSTPSSTASISTTSSTENEIIESTSSNCKAKKNENRFVSETVLTSVGDPKEKKNESTEFVQIHSENRKEEIKLNSDQTTDSSEWTKIFDTNCQVKTSFKHENKLLVKTKIDVKKYDDKMVSQLPCKQEKKKMSSFESIIEEEEEEETLLKMNSVEKTAIDLSSSSNPTSFEKGEIIGINGKQGDQRGLSIPFDVKFEKNRTTKTEVTMLPSQQENTFGLNNAVCRTKDNVTLNHASRTSKPSETLKKKKYEEKMVGSQVYSPKKKVPCFETIIEEEPVGVSIQVSDGGSMKLSVKDIVHAFDAGLLPEALVREKLTPIPTEEMKTNENKVEFKKLNMKQLSKIVSMDAVKENNLKLKNNLNELVVKSKNITSVMKTPCSAETQGNNAGATTNNGIIRRSSMNPSEKTLTLSDVKSVPPRVLMNVQEDEEEKMENSNSCSAQKDDASTFYTSQDSKELISNSDLTSFLPKSNTRGNSLDCERKSEALNATPTIAVTPTTKAPWIKRMTQKIKSYVSSRIQRRKKRNNP